MPREARSWVKDGYLVSSDQSLLQLEAINEALASDLMWWTQRLPDDTLKTMVESSLCLGLYKLHDPSTTGAGTAPLSASGYPPIFSSTHNKQGITPAHQR